MGIRPSLFPTAASPYRMAQTPKETFDTKESHATQPVDSSFHMPRSPSEDVPETTQTRSPYVRGRLWERLRQLSRRPADLALRLNASPWRMWYLGVASFLETTVVPVAIELVMLPFMLANRDRLWTIATVTLAGCLAGAGLGYLVGWLFFDTVGLWLIDSFGQRETFQAFENEFAENGFWAIVAIGITPIPFPIAMLAAGATEYSFPLYCLACALARGVRYYGLAILVAIAGPRVIGWFSHGRPAVRMAIAIATAIIGAAVVAYLLL